MSTPSPSSTRDAPREGFQPPERPWTLSAPETAEALGADPEQGLGQSEARERLRRFGPNRLEEAPRRSVWVILFDQFRSLMVLLLAAASLVSTLFGSWLEGLAIGVALLINAAIGFGTELKATRSMEALRELGRTRARVRRGGETREVDDEEVVPGDLVLLEAGDLVPADLRLVEANNLRVDEAALTGESVPRQKRVEPVAPDAPLAERDCLCHKGTALTAGSGAGLAFATGMETQLGRVASLASAEGEQVTPLERRLGELSRRLIGGTAGVAAVVTAAGLLGGKDWLLMLKTAIAMAVAAVPEGLPIVATIALARGVRRMAAHNALVNRLSAVETLGATDVICTDKTGTLTENRMRVRRVDLPGREVPFDQGDEPAADDELLRRALEVAALCNNASLGAEGESVGDPTEVALLEAAARLDLDREDLLERWPEAREVAFDAETKRMATVHRQGDEVRAAVKGAPEAILPLCSRAAAAEGEDAADWSEEERQGWEEKNRELAGRGLRVLALAEKRGGAEDDDPFGDLTFLGLVSLMDPPREDVKEVLAGCRSAGIRIIMVTGDQRDTAVGVAEAVALTGEDEIVALQGEELESLEERSAEERSRLLRASVFARVSPEQKLELVRLHQERGSVVAMTGDGVNDAPALKKADIGVAMGERGTQVAREAADMVLTDDRLATVAVAVEYGRVVFENIRKFIVFLLSGNVSEVLVLTAAGLAGAPLPLLPLQILYVNLIGDVFPALALGVGPKPPGVMGRPPRGRDEPILTRGHWLAVGGYSLILSAAILAAFAAALRVLDLDAAGAVTVSFLTLIFARLLHVFNMRDPKSPLLRNEITVNPYVWGALAICVALALVAVYVPFLAQVLGLRPLGPPAWGLVLGASGASLLAGQCAAPLLAPARTRRAGGPAGGRAAARAGAPEPRTGEDP